MFDVRYEATSTDNFVRSLSESLSLLGTFATFLYICNVARFFKQSFIMKLLRFFLNYHHVLHAFTIKISEIKGNTRGEVTLPGTWPMMDERGKWLVIETLQYLNTN